MVTGCGGLFINICESEAGVPVELFATIGKGGNCPKANMEALGRMVSLSFRNRIPPEKIIRQLLSIGCHRAAGMGPKKILSCSDAIAKALKKYMEGKGTPVKNMVEKTNHSMCQDCGAPIEYSEGCAKCPQCGWSQCS